MNPSPRGCSDVVSNVRSRGVGKKPVSHLSAMYPGVTAVRIQKQKNFKTDCDINNFFKSQICQKSRAICRHILQCLYTLHITK